MSQRRSVLIGAGIPILFVIGILVWGVIQNDGQAGRPGVNSNLGTVPVTAQEGADFTVTTLDGETLSLSGLEGKVVMIDFWSSWCAPCQAEAPVLAESYQTWKDRGVEFVGIAIWDRESDVQQFVDANDIEYPNAIDANGSIAVEFGVSGIPEKFFVMPDGEIVRKVVGPNTRRSLDEILGEMVDEAIGITATR